MQTCLAQQFVVRSLVNPRHGPSTHFLLNRLLQPNEDGWNGFGRPVQSLGLRMMFPQHEQNQEVFNIRIETWNADPRSLWIENVGSFTRPTPIENIPELSTYLYSTYRFISQQVLSFVAGFDQQ